MGWWGGGVVYIVYEFSSAACGLQCIFTSVQLLPFTPHWKSSVMLRSSRLGKYIG